MSVCVCVSHILRYVCACVWVDVCACQGVTTTILLDTHKDKKDIAHVCIESERRCF